MNRTFPRNYNRFRNATTALEGIPTISGAIDRQLKECGELSADQEAQADQEIAAAVAVLRQRRVEQLKRFVAPAIDAEDGDA